MKTKLWIGIFFVLFVIFVATSFFLYHTGSDGQVANIYQDGVCIASVSLSDTAEPQTFTITDAHGHENTITCQNGAIRISSANCPDQVCVNTGWISDSAKPIVCLPAKLVIQIEKSAASAQVVDAVSG